MTLICEQLESRVESQLCVFIMIYYYHLDRTFFSYLWWRENVAEVWD